MNGSHALGQVFRQDAPLSEGRSRSFALPGTGILAEEGRRQGIEWASPQSGRMLVAGPFKARFDNREDRGVAERRFNHAGVAPRRGSRSCSLFRGLKPTATGSHRSAMMDRAVIPTPPYSNTAATDKHCSGRPGNAGSGSFAVVNC